MRKTIPLPIAGLHTDTAVSDQPPQTTRQCSNVRPIDPTTGRRRLSVRAGMADILGGAELSPGSPVRAMVSIMRTAKRTTYAESIPPTVDWSFVGDSADAARGVKVDAQGNQYWLAARDQIIMRNSAGVLVWKLPLPVDDASQIVRAFDVEPGGLIFCGVSEGSDQELTHLWCYEQIENGQAPQQLWEINEVGFVQQVRYHEGRLYTIQDFPAEGRSSLTIYRGASTATPQVDTFDPRLPFPTAGLDVGPDGSAYVCSGENLTRGVDPRYPQLSPVREDWRLGDLAKVSERVWAHYTAERPSLLLPPDDGDTLTRIDDISGNERHLYASSGESSGVQWIEQGVGARPALRFDGSGSGFESAANLNSNTDPERILTMLPSYAGARWALVMLIRRTNPASTARETLWAQDFGTNGNDPHRLTGNEDTAGGNTANLLSWQTDSGPTSQKDATYEEFNLVSILFNADGAGRAIYRVNGTPWARVVLAGGSQGTVTEQTFFAWTGVGGSEERFAGDLIEAVVLRDYKDAAGATQLITHPSYPDEAWSPTSDFELEKLEGWIAWKNGVQHILDDGTVTGLDVSSITAQPWPHPFHLRPRFSFKDAVYNHGAQTITKVGAFATYFPTLVPGKADTIEIIAANGNGVLATYQVASKTSNDTIVLVTSIGTTATLVSGVYLGFAAFDVESNSGGPPTIAPRPTALTVGTAYWRNNISFPGLWEKWTGGKLVLNEARTSGVGQGILVRSLDLDGDGEPTTYVWSLGPHYRNLTTYLRRYKDNGDSVTQEGALGSLAGQVINPDYPWPRMDADEFGTVYFPFHDPDTGYSGGIQSVGWALFDFSTGLNVYKLPDGQQGYAVAVDPNIPKYEMDPVLIAEFIYLATRNESNPALTTQHRLRMVTRTLDAGAAPRERIDLGVAGGHILRFDSGTPTAITGGTSALSPDSPWTGGVDFYGEVIFWDGVRYVVFTKENEIEPLISEGAGEIPRAAKLGMVWNGKLWFGRFEDDPYLFASSARDDPRDWDADPVVANVGQSFVAPLAASGRVPHLLTAMIPWTDAARDERTGSVAVLGCDHAIWVMEGDIGAGGTIYLKTNEMGIANGQKPWATSPQGTLYFVNDAGQFCMWPIGGQPKAISEGRVDQRFRDFDLGTYMPFLVYDRDARGVHIYLVPYAPTHLVRVDHYFFCEVSHGIEELGVGRVGAFGSFWPIAFGTADVQPVCAMVRDGDLPEDRSLLLGLSNGLICRVSGDYQDDNGEQIDSDLVIGPLVEREAPEMALFTAYQVELAEGQFGCTASVYAHRSAQESMGQSVKDFFVDPGMNDPVYQPARGAYCYLRLRGNVRWSLENAAVDVEAGGMKRRA